MSANDWDNNLVHVTTYYPDKGDVYSMDYDGIITQYHEFDNFGLPALTDPNADRSGIYIDFTPSSVTFSVNPRPDGYQFASAGFNGYVVTNRYGGYTTTSEYPDDTAHLSDVVLSSSSISGLTQSDISFDAHSISIDFSGASIPPDTAAAFTLTFGFNGEAAQASDPSSLDVEFDQRPVFIKPGEAIISGSVSDPSAYVEIFDGDEDLGPAQVAADGTWTFDGAFGQKELAQLTAVATSPDLQSESAASPYVLASGAGEGLPGLLHVAREMTEDTEQLASTLTLGYRWLAEAENTAGAKAVSRLAQSVAHLLGAGRFLASDAVANHEAASTLSDFTESAERFATTATVLGAIGSIYEAVNGAIYLSNTVTPEQPLTDEQIEAQSEIIQGAAGLASLHYHGAAALGGVIAHVRAASQDALQGQFGKMGQELGQGAVIFGFSALGATLSPLDPGEGADIGAAVGKGAITIENALIEKGVDAFYGSNEQPIGEHITSNFLPLFYHST